MARYRTGYNTTDRPIPIDADGRTLAGGEWGPVLASTDEAKAAVEAGTIVFGDAPKDPSKADPAAVAAFAATDDLNAAAGPEELAETAADVGATPTPAAKRAQAKAQAEEEK